MSEALAKTDGGINIQSAIEQALVMGDLTKLTPAQRVEFYQATCRSLGLNPLTKPFDYLNLNGKLTLYARRDCTDQLRNVHGISVIIVCREILEGIYVVTARATLPNGRTDESTGAVPIDGTKGENRANALMKAETKAKRRVTLSIVGLGMLDESELETVRGAKTGVIDAGTGAPTVTVDPSTGEVMPSPIDLFESRIAQSDAMPSLQSLAADIASASRDGKLSESDIAKLKSLWGARRDLIAKTKAPDAAEESKAEGAA